MPTSPEIRTSTRDDIEAIVDMYPLAFPDEDLVPLVRALLPDEDIVMSLVATLKGEIVGHVAFTTCSLEGSSLSASLLAPLAVAPDFQRQGVGSAIVSSGLKRLRDSRVDVVFVLGDPTYYSRLGFAPETHVQPPYPLPAEWYSAWQSQRLGDASSAGAGKLVVPRQWLDPGLWAP